MFDIHTYTEVGGHPHNEDAFLVQAHPDDPEVLLCVIADGQGGQVGGGVATRLACAAALQYAAKIPCAKLTASAWRAVLEVADRAVCADASAGFTTLLGFSVRTGLVCGASCGDSALLLATSDRIHDLTSHQAKNPPIGAGDAAITPFAVPIGAGDRLLAMTDGVWKYVGWDRVHEGLRTMSGAALLATLVEAARLRNSRMLQDDFTAIWVGYSRVTA